LRNHYVVIDPIGKGWIKEGNGMGINWMNEKPAPESILAFVSCNCKKNKCNANSCSCYGVNLPCTDMCGCNNCENQNNCSEDEEESDSDNNSSCDEEIFSSDEELTSNEDD